LEQKVATISGAPKRAGDGALALLFAVVAGGELHRSASPWRPRRRVGGASHVRTARVAGGAKVATVMGHARPDTTNVRDGKFDNSLGDHLIGTIAAVCKSKS
jgi:hypothetical protein